MRKSKFGRQKLQLLFTLILFTIAGCNFPKQEKIDISILATPIMNTLESHYSTETAVHKSRIEIITITMPQLGNRPRNIQIYLPPDYDLSNSNYPVIYLFDGDSLFNPPPAGVGDYLIDDTMDSLYKEKLTQGMIVVGVEYDPDSAWSEYMPWINPAMHDWVMANNSKVSEGGEGDAFPNFIFETLRPEVDSRYRTLTDRDNTMLGGFCRTAVIPLYAVLTWPNVFSKAMVMSPAVWLAEGGGPWLSNNQLIEFIKSTEVLDHIRIYIDIGTQESSGPEPNVLDQNGKRISYLQAYVEGDEKLFNALSSQGIPENNLRFEIFEGAVGTRDECAKRFGSAILWLVQEI